MANRIAYIVRKEVRQAFREPRMRAMLFVPPLIQLLVFGYAVNLDVENAKMAWMDQDRTPQSRDLLSRFQGSTRFSVAAAPETDDQVTTLLDSGKVDVVVRVLPNFGRDILRGRKAEVQLLVNGSNSNTASLVASYASGVVTGYARDAMNDESRVKL